MRANLKDVCTLIDSKANIEDVNNTLSLVQKEVERCIRDDDLRNTLD
jgi:hypothetical protein